MKSIQWLEQAKAKIINEEGDCSDYKLAQRVGLSRQNMSKHRNLKSDTLEDKPCILIAETLDIEPMIIISDQNLERARTESDINFWKNVAQKLKNAEECILC